MQFEIDFCKEISNFRRKMLKKDVYLKISMRKKYSETNLTAPRCFSDWYFQNGFEAKFFSDFPQHSEKN
jgi:hypothetical protein